MIIVVKLVYRGFNVIALVDFSIIVFSASIDM